MPLLGYKKQFAPMIESGEKRQTIRAMRKRPFKLGDRLYHYVGLRTKACRKLLESDCLEVSKIKIDDQGTIYINGLRLISNAYEPFATADGFRADKQKSAYQKMIQFFKTNHGLPFEDGQLIMW